MKINSQSSWMLGAFCAALLVSACATKKPEGEGEVAGDQAAAVQPTDVNAAAATPDTGAPIAELSTVYFNYDSFELTAQAKKSLDAHAGWLKSNPTRNVQIEGHCDERGTTEYNLALGERRAGVVKDFLISKGVPAAQLSTISYGEERPAVLGSTEQAWAKNRRAEFVSLGGH